MLDVNEGWYEYRLRARSYMTISQWPEQTEACVTDGMLLATDAVVSQHVKLFVIRFAIVLVPAG